MENGNGSFNDKDTLFMLGGVALMVFGAGLILTNPIARRYMGQLVRSAIWPTWLCRIWIDI